MACTPKICLSVGRRPGIVLQVALRHDSMNSHHELDLATDIWIIFNGSAD